MSPILELRRISFSYKNPLLKTSKTIFRDFSLRIEPGEKLIIEGESGSGKSTLLRLMAWLEEPDTGEMFFNGKPYDAYSPPALRRMVSLVQQTPVMLDGSVRQNLLLGLDEPAADEALEEWLARLRLSGDLLDKPAMSLSVGQMQRVALIRTLLINPRVLLLDEPTSGLDGESAGMLVSAVESMTGEKGLTAVWVSHDPRVLGLGGAETVTINGVRS